MLSCSPELRLYRAERVVSKLFAVSCKRPQRPCVIQFIKNNWPTGGRINGKSVLRDSSPTGRAASILHAIYLSSIAGWAIYRGDTVLQVIDVACETDGKLMCKSVFFPIILKELSV